MQAKEAKSESVTEENTVINTDLLPLPMPIDEYRKEKKGFVLCKIIS
jgi:hypothetical protein